MAFGTAKSVEVSSFQGVLIRGFHKTAVVGRGKGGGGGEGGETHYGKYTKGLKGRLKEEGTKGR